MEQKPEYTKPLITTYIIGLIIMCLGMVIDKKVLICLGFLITIPMLAFAFGMMIYGSSEQAKFESKS